MRTHEELKTIALSKSEVKTEYDRINREEMPMLDAILKSRKRYSLKKLLKNANTKTIQELSEETQWVFDHGTIGREL